MAKSIRRRRKPLSPYRANAVKRILKARAAKPVRAGMSATELTAWLND